MERLKATEDLKFTRSFVCSGVIMKKEKKIIKVVIVGCGSFTRFATVDL